MARLVLGKDLSLIRHDKSLKGLSFRACGGILLDVTTDGDKIKPLPGGKSGGKLRAQQYKHNNLVRTTSVLAI